MRTQNIIIFTSRYADNYKKKKKVTRSKTETPRKKNNTWIIMLANNYEKNMVLNDYKKYRWKE